MSNLCLADEAVPRDHSWSCQQHKSFLWGGTSRPLAWMVHITEADPAKVLRKVEITVPPPGEVRGDFIQQVSFVLELVVWREWLMRIRLRDLRGL